MSIPKFDDAQELHDALVKRIADQQAEMERLHYAIEEDRNALQTIEDFLQVWRAVNGIVEPNDDLTMVAKEIVIPKIHRRKPKNPDRNLVVEKVRAYVCAAEKPLKRSELFRRLSADNIHIQGKDPQMVLSTMLWRSKDSVVRLGSHGYWLTEEPYEPLHYDPTIDDIIGIARSEPDDDPTD